MWIVSPSSVSQINLSHFWRSGRIAITSTLTALQLRGFRAANIESFLRGAFPPVYREAVCLVRAMDWDIAKDLLGVRGTPGVYQGPGYKPAQELERLEYARIHLPCSSIGTNFETRRLRCGY